MSSPFDPGRDSSAAKGVAFDAQPDVMAQDAGDATAQAFHVAGNKLNEEDYR